jgi:hypothetical protein
VPTEFYVAKGVPHGFYTSEGKVQLNVLQLSVESHERVQAVDLNVMNEILYIIIVTQRNTLLALFIKISILCFRSF